MGYIHVCRPPATSDCPHHTSLPASRHVGTQPSVLDYRQQKRNEKKRSIRFLMRHTNMFVIVVETGFPAWGMGVGEWGGGVRVVVGFGGSQRSLIATLSHGPGVCIIFNSAKSVFKTLDTRSKCPCAEHVSSVGIRSVEISSDLIRINTQGS